MSSTRQSIGMILAAAAALAAAPAPAGKAFLQAKAMYLTFEITATGAAEFGAGKDAITDGAHRTNQSVKYTMLLDMAMPDTCPPSTQAISMEDAMEQGRCTAWSAQPPMDAAMEMLSGGKPPDISSNPMFVPVEFSIDDVSQFRYRDSPDHGWGTQTTKLKGRGTAYTARSGMLLCDVKRMACDLNAITFKYDDGKDLVTVTTTSDVSGFEPTTETQGPGQLLPKIPPDIAQKLTSFAFTLPEPSTVTFSDVDPERGNQKVTLKMTLSSKPPAKTPAPTPKP